MFLTKTKTLGFHEELRDLGRGVSWGLIFGMPVLYTMEIWIGAKGISHLSLLLILTLILFLNILFSYFAGLRKRNNGRHFNIALEDGVTSLALALCISFVVLSVIGQIHRPYSWETMLSKVVLEAAIMSVGITITNVKFKDIELSQIKKRLNGSLHLPAIAAGAFIYSFNVAPTEEILLIASKLGDAQLLYLFIVELVFCYIVLHFSGFGLQHTIFEKISSLIHTYTLSFITAAALILSIGYGEITISHPLFIPATLALTLPAVVGGSAGRLAV